MPLADWPVAVRNFTPARSAWSSCARMIGQQRALDRRLRRLHRRRRRHCPCPTLPERAPATIAPTPRIIATIDCVCATAQSARASRDRWPPAMWPVSCASTPMISFGVSASISAPALMKMRRPSVTKALKRAVVDDDDLDVLLGKPGGAQDRLGVFAQELLDLGVANQRQALRVRGLRLRRNAAATMRRRRGDASATRRALVVCAPRPDQGFAVVMRRASCIGLRFARRCLRRSG